MKKLIIGIAIALSVMLSGGIVLADNSYPDWSELGYSWPTDYPMSFKNFSEAYEFYMILRPNMLLNEKFKSIQ